MVSIQTCFQLWTHKVSAGRHASVKNVRSVLMDSLYFVKINPPTIPNSFRTFLGTSLYNNKIRHLILQFLGNHVIYHVEI